MPKKTFICNICGKEGEIVIKPDTRQSSLVCGECGSRLLSPKLSEEDWVFASRACGSLNFCDECGLCDHVRKTNVEISLVRTKQTEAPVDIPLIIKNKRQKKAQSFLSY
jgi:DNA-directed RNA polymerase subunit RPC12/RpoP